MSIFTNHMMAAAASRAGTPAAVYTIDNSCIFDSSSSPYMQRNPSSAGNQKTWTISFWFKLCTRANATSGGIPFFTVESTEIKISDTDDKFYSLEPYSYSC